MVYEIVTGNAAIQKSFEWLELRRKYITASDIPIIMGRSPYKTVEDLINEKTTGQTETLSQDKIELFKKAEDIESKARQELIGDGYNFETRVIISKTVPELLASLDGFDQKYNTILEVKYIGRVKLNTLTIDKNLPLHHFIQIQAQLLASGAKKCLYYASDSKNIFLKDIMPDLDFFELIKKEIKAFIVKLNNVKSLRNAARDNVPKIEDQSISKPEVKELIMSKEVVPTNSNNDFTANQKHLLKTQICPGASDDELSLFMAVAKKTGLDPFSRQIYGFMRKEKSKTGQWLQKLSIQTSIDGFRLIAARTNEYEGQVGPLWCGEDGEWKDVWLSNLPPAAAKVGVWRKGFKEPIYSVAKFESYAQRYDGKLSNMWQKFSDLMISKCAEALALRRAFPNELSGIYSSDEMAQTQNIERPEVPARALPQASPEPDFDSMVDAEFERLSKEKPKGNQASLPL